MRATHRRPRRRRGRRRDPGPGHQGGPVPPGRDEHPRPLLLTGAQHRSACASRCRRARPPSSPRPSGDPSCRSASSPPTSSGCGRCSTTCAPRWRAEHGWAVVRRRAVPGPRARRSTSSGVRTSVGQLDDDRRARATSSAAADATGVRAGRRCIGFCMGGMYALKAAGTGRFDRAVALLRDDPRARALAGSPRQGEPLDVLARAGRVPGAGDHRRQRPVDTRPADVDALEALPASTVVRYAGRRARLRARPRPTGAPPRRRRRRLAALLSPSSPAQRARQLEPVPLSAIGSGGRAARASRGG